MSVSVDSGDGKSVDVEINLVPFIDLMTCLVSFLLLTAAWTNLAQISMKPKGVGRDTEKVQEEQKDVKISVLVASDSHWVGLTTGDRRQIKKNGPNPEDYDYGELTKTLDEIRNAGVLKELTDEKNEKYWTIEIAAEDGVKYQDIISTMDTAISTKFKDVGYVDPSSLSVRFKQ